MARANSVAIAATLAGTVRRAWRAHNPGRQITFTDVTARAGITFVHHNGAAGNKWYPELFGGGVAVLDVDGDSVARPAVRQRQGLAARRAGALVTASIATIATARSPMSSPAADSTRPTSTGWARPSPTTTTTAATMSS